MRIAQIAPLTEAVPPKLYGGTERVVSFLTEELVAMGHDVTLFASGDSVTRAKLEAVWPRALRLDPTIRDFMGPHMLLMERVRQMAHEFDVLHFHMDYWPASLFSRQGVPFVTTLHGRLDLPELRPVFAGLPPMSVVSISDSQRLPLPEANFIATIHHGLPEYLLTPRPTTQDYVAFLGRICPEKRPDRAIRIARAAGVNLRLAAKVDRADIDYHESTIKPMLGPDADLIGEIDDRNKPEFLSGAKALLMPIDWPEPFGLVMIEAMACGTPVIAYGHGSVPEIIEDGVTGFIVNSEEEAVAALRRIDDLSRTRIRAEFERRFTARRMAEDYLDTYERLMVPKSDRLRLVG
ncbi:MULTISPECIES: glycosyltransferase family 4 protein [Acidiphilium]|uniref:Glycosyltransferase involved in cell wall bisynthesis n=1 Tax=Acidiphilium rubrum TaxID=526 RepID=A0A8G2CL90_ACIRU|nr:MULTISPECIES: glycosyltransferase family 4 protein [Acidiphilium]MBW4034048.1 glycosyltransferase family 4 protein [Pseudomonadota bacterium]SIQ95913.1 Glycosyltransferase involved in cell wall bisynthesis [Acidiphilium rubrum]